VWRGAVSEARTICGRKNVATPAIHGNTWSLDIPRKLSFFTA